MPSRRSGRFAASASLGVVCAAACGPSQSFRPAGSLPDPGSRELGLALSSIEPRPYVDEDTQRLGQVWWATALDERWSLTLLAAFDSAAASGGTALRRDLLRASAAAVSLEIELGVFWAAVAVPASLRLWPGAALYCTPRLGNWGAELTPFIPVGLSSQVADGVTVRLEAELTWADFQYYNRRVHWGLALVHPW